MTTAKNPWRVLSSHTQADLAKPLLDPRRYRWDQSQFRMWYQRYYANTGVDPKSVYPEWRFNHRFTAEERNSFLCVYAKLRREKLWFSVKTIDWVGSRGEILFWPKGGEPVLVAHLTRNGYGNWWLAKGFSDRWGLRSRFRGPQLHFRANKTTGKRVDVHIDLNNPGDPTKPGAPPTDWTQERPLKHLVDDLISRKTTHTAPKLQKALRTQGIRIPSVP